MFLSVSRVCRGSPKGLSQRSHLFRGKAGYVGLCFERQRGAINGHLLRERWTLLVKQPWAWTALFILGGLSTHCSPQEPSAVPLSLQTSATVEWSALLLTPVGGQLIIFTQISNHGHGVLGVQKRKYGLGLGLGLT